MVQNIQFKSIRRDVVLMSLLVFAISLMITSVVFFSVRANQDVKRSAYIDARMREVVFKIEQQLQTYQQVLLGASGLFQVTNQVDRERFRDYVASLKLAENLPGIQGVGFSVIVPPAQRQTHLATIRVKFPNYTLLPPGERDLYTAIIYLEPFTERNLRAFGYDMYAEPVRHAAMQLALDSNQSTLSGKVKLVQESSRDQQAGFLMYTPIYRHNLPHSSVAQRRENAIGWVYAPFRMTDFIEGVLGELSHQFSYEIYDSKTISLSTLLFDSDAEMFNVAPLLTQSENYQDYSVRALNQTWTVRLIPRPKVVNNLFEDLPTLTAVVGVLLSFLLTWLTWLILNRWRLAQQLIVVNTNLAAHKIENIKRASELEIANKELLVQQKKNRKRTEELAIINDQLAYEQKEKHKHAEQLAIANQELLVQQKEKRQRIEEWEVVSDELAFQQKETRKRAEELALAEKVVHTQAMDKREMADELQLVIEELSVANRQLTENKKRLDQNQAEIDRLVFDDELTNQTKNS